MAYGEGWNSSSFSLFSGNGRYGLNTNRVLSPLESLNEMNSEPYPSYTMSRNGPSIGQGFSSYFPDTSCEESSINVIPPLSHPILRSELIWNQIPDTPSQCFPRESRGSHLQSLYLSRNHPISNQYCHPFMDQFFEMEKKKIWGSSSPSQNQNYHSQYQHLQPQMVNNRSCRNYPVVNEYWHQLMGQFQENERGLIRGSYSPMMNKNECNLSPYLHTFAPKLSRNSSSDLHCNTQKLSQQKAFLCQTPRRDPSGSNGKTLSEYSIASSSNLSGNATAQELDINDSRDCQDPHLNSHLLSQKNSLACQKSRRDPSESDRTTETARKYSTSSSSNLSGNATAQELDSKDSRNCQDPHLNSHLLSQKNSLACQKSGRDSSESDRTTETAREYSTSCSSNLYGEEISSSDGRTETEGSLACSSDLSGKKSTPDDSNKSDVDTRQSLYPKHPQTINIIVIGSSLSPPHNLIQTYARNNETKFILPFSMVFKKRVLNFGVSYEVKVWCLFTLRDCKQRFEKLCKTSKSVIILVYDVEKDQSFFYILNRIHALKNMFPNTVPIVLVGNNTTGETRTVLNQTSSPGLKLIPYKVGTEARTKFKLSLFVECSVKSFEDVDALVSCAIIFASNRKF